MIKKLLINIIVRLYASTFRMKISGKNPVDKLFSEKKRIVFLVWHNQLMCILGLAKGHRLATMISRSRDGAYFASLVEGLGVKVVRASSSRGASAGTMEMLVMMNGGYSAVMASDGPKGPKYEIKSGGLYLAKKADCIIVPILADCKRFHRFNSWDRFILPKLFSKIDITFCEPVYVSESLDKEEMEKELNALQNKIMDMTRVYSKNII